MPHPYAEFEGSDLWRVIDAELGTLEGNRDLQITTARGHVVGSLCRRLLKEGLAVARRDQGSAGD